MDELIKTVKYLLDENAEMKKKEKILEKEMKRIREELLTQSVKVNKQDKLISENKLKMDLQEQYERK